MKRLVISLITLTLMVAGARAALVFNEAFNYPDGSLNTNGTWVTHSAQLGQTGQVDVASQKVNITQNEAEDVSAPIPGAPYTTGNIYMSAKVNFSTLPVTSGTYFLHFRDSSTSIFKARVYAVTTGAASGFFRLGIANAASASTTAGVAIIPTDLSLNTDYTIVVRYNVGSPAATLWINPSGEGSSTDRGDATDTTTVASVNNVCLRQSGSEGVLTLDDLKVGTSFSDVVGVNPELNPPSMSALDDVSIPANTITAVIPFTVSDGETSATSLVVTTGSSNPTLIPTNNIVLGGSGTNRTVTVTPAAGQEGSGTVILTVTDSDNNSVSRSFVVTVGAPFISVVPEQSTLADAPIAAIPFLVGDAESPASSLTVTATSTNTTLVAAGDIVLGGSGSNRTVTITPEPGQTGITRITLSVTDGFNAVSNNFMVTVSPLLGVLLTDDFTYPDGALYLNTGSPWQHHSGTFGDLLVTNGTVFLSRTNSEDLNSALLNGPYDPNLGVVYYTKFTVNFVELPTQSAGDYFIHFKDIGTSSFRAKVFAVTNGAAVGKFRLGIANGANNVTTGSTMPTDLSLNTTYTVVTRYNSGTGTSKLWINPSYETDFNVSAADSGSNLTNAAVALRQSNGYGSLYVDNLKVGTAFTNVVDFVAPPASIPLNITTAGSNITLSWTNAAFKLQSATSVAGPYSDVLGAASPYTTSTTGSEKYFRLKF